MASRGKSKIFHRSRIFAILYVRSYAIAHTVVSRAKGQKIGAAIVWRLAGGQVRRSGSVIGFGGQLGGKSATFRNFDFTQQ